MHRNRRRRGRTTSSIDHILGKEPDSVDSEFRTVVRDIGSSTVDRKIQHVYKGYVMMVTPTAFQTPSAVEAAFLLLPLLPRRKVEAR